MNAVLQALQELLPAAPVLRGLLKFGAVVGLSCLLLVVLFDPYITNPAGKVIVVYDSEDDDNASKQALNGIMAAATPGDIVPVRMNDGENPYTQLAQSTVNLSILGVISTLTSPNSMPIVRFCRTLRVPLLIAIAANDDLLSQENGTQGLVFRIVPTNRMQAQNMYDWLAANGDLALKLPHDVPRHIAIFHEGNAFGSFLHQEFLKKLKEHREEKPGIITYSYAVNEHTEFSMLLPELRCNHTDLIAYFGFFPRSLELLNKLKSYPAPAGSNKACLDQEDGHDHTYIPVLLSDGAYQRELEDPAKYRFPFPIWAALPSVPRDHDVAFEYGHDAYTLMARMRSNVGNPLRRPPLVSLLQFHEPTRTRHQLTFEAGGELTNVPENRYKLYLLNSPVAGGPGRLP